MDISDDGADPAAKQTKPIGATEVRQSILDAALKLMSKQGNTDVALREIAREANVNHGLVHRHFGTRQDVLIAALQRHSEIGADYLQDAANIDTAIHKLWTHPNMAESAKLMASALLGGVAPKSIAEGHALRKLEQLLQAGDTKASPDDTTARAVALSCLILGWGVFGSYLTAVAQDSDPEQLRANVLDVLHEMARPQQASGG